MLWIAALVCLLPAVAGPQVSAGAPIVAIRIDRHNVFDTDDQATAAWPYRWANALHVVSRESFIRSLLLFKEGDLLDPARLAESERLLRATGFLSPVHITAHPAPGGAEVVVHTRDQWTLEVSIILGLAGSKTSTGFTLSEKNFFGWGKRVELEYRDRPERVTTMLIYEDPLFFGTRWRLKVAHTEASDGSSDAFRLVYPFFALNTPMAGGVEWSREGLREYLWAAGKKTVLGNANRDRFRLWGGLRLGKQDDVTNRLTAGLFADRSRFSDWSWAGGETFPTPDDVDMVGVEVGWERQIDRWVVLQGFRAWQRQEDLPLGPNWNLRAGLSLPQLGGDSHRWLLGGDVTLGAQRGRTFSWLYAAVSGRLDGTRWANAVTSVETGIALPGRRGWRGRIAIDIGHNLDRDRQLTLGSNAGLRGWEPDTFDGTSRGVLNIEWRRQITGEVLSLAVLGVTVFADAGQSWAPRVGPDTSGVRSDVGLGLTAEVTRAAILRIVRLEVAWGDDGSGPLVLLTSSSLF
jgi:hypothetical protein